MDASGARRARGAGQSFAPHAVGRTGACGRLYLPALAVVRAWRGRSHDMVLPRTDQGRLRSLESSVRRARARRRRLRRKRPGFPPVIGARIASPRVTPVAPLR